ncbi:hypothetical protein Slin15195_G003450 [Septoria linicola]|uniref:DUF7905 domain-containing protein n=1 Tax=Septoria linicola TaxID=215465 RepID=A0A9Q9ECT0_9PEZI|nr:hypothetical protein Slin14017_G003480 [Septoria linicola]USW47026.1 hypothetical protein Slin15195_G003450 [Septoria linicola]
MDYELQNSRAWDEELKDTHEPVVSGEFTWVEVPTGNTPKGAALPKKKNAKQAASSRVAARQPQFVQSLATKQVGQAFSRQARLPAVFYRRAPPGEWQTARRGRLILNEGPAQIREIDTEQISAAQASWRARKLPNATISVPLGIATDLCENLASIAVENGCFLHREKYNSGDTAALGIWGEKSKVQLTKQKIAHALGDDRGQGAGKGYFAKLQSLTPVLRPRHQKRWEQEVKRNRYRQIPPQDVVFGAIGSFHWPSTEYKPEDVLGSSYEALDSIRMDLKCFINYLADGNCFQVMGESKEVQQALLRIRKTCFQLTSRTINPVRVYLPHWRASVVPSHVYLEEYHGPRIIMGATKEEEEEQQKPMHSPRGEGTIEGAQELADAHQSSLLGIERVRLTLANAFKKLHYYQGHITLVIRLGTFVLQRYRTPEDELYELKEYEEMVKESQFYGKVTEEVGDAAATDGILATIQGAEDILVPQDAMIDHPKDVRATFSAVFVFEEEGKKVGDLRLVKSWHETKDEEDVSYQLVEDPDQWTRLDRDIGAPVQLVDLALTDLHTGGAWQFDITSTRSIDKGKLPITMLDFAKNVKIDTAAALRHDEVECFVTCRSAVPFKALRQEVHYRYNIRQSDYRLDLVRFQNFAYRQGKRISQTVSVVTEGQEERQDVPKSAWGLSVSRADWNSEFSKNERLPVGTSAEWPDDMESWFPASVFDDDYGSDGFRSLVSKLAKIEKVLRPETAEDQ